MYTALPVIFFVIKSANKIKYEYETNKQFTKLVFFVVPREKKGTVRAEVYTTCVSHLSINYSNPSCKLWMVDRFTDLCNFFIFSFLDCKEGFHGYNCQSRCNNQCRGGCDKNTSYCTRMSLYTTLSFFHLTRTNTKYNIQSHIEIMDVRSL